MAAFVTTCAGMTRVCRAWRFTQKYIWERTFHSGAQQNKGTMFVLRSSTVMSTKVDFRAARALSQLPNPDADIERLQQASQQADRRPPTTNDARLIYRVRAIGMMRLCTLGFYATTLTGVYMVPDIIASMMEHDNIGMETVANCVAIVVAVGVLPVLVTLFNNRLVLRLYYNDKEKAYTAMTQSPLLIKRRATFTHADVIPNRKVGTILSIFKLNTLRAKGRPYYVNPYNFVIPSDYNNLMGYR